MGVHGSGFMVEVASGVRDISPTLFALSTAELLWAFRGCHDSGASVLCL